MELSGIDNEHLNDNTPDSEFDPNVTFLQIPTQLKEPLTLYLAELVKDDPELETLISREKDPARRSGCFFIISLETIEKVLTYLKKCQNSDLCQSKEISEYIAQSIRILSGR